MSDETTEARSKPRDDSRVEAVRRFRQCAYLDDDADAVVPDVSSGQVAAWLRLNACRAILQDYAFCLDGAACDCEAHVIAAVIESENIVSTKGLEKA